MTKGGSTTHRSLGNGLMNVGVATVQNAEHSAASTATEKRSVSIYVPPRLFLLLGLFAAAIGVTQAYWIGAAILVIAACLSILVAWWAHRQGGALVAAIALVVFWLPFHTTFSRFGISPQEVTVYGIWCAGALFSPLGIRRWILDVFASISSLMRVVLLLLALACLQSLLRISHPSLVNDVNAIRTILAYPVLLALLIAYAVRTRGSAWVFIQALVWGGVCFATYALLLRVWGVEVRDGAVAGRLGAESSFLSWYHPNNLALYLAMALSLMPAVAAHLWQSNRARGIKLVAAIAGTGLALTALVLTYARGAFAAFILGILLLFVLLIVSWNRRARILGLGALLGGVGGAIAIVAWRGPEILGRYATLTSISAVKGDDNIQFRLNLFARALAQAQSHLFTGIGLSNFSSQSDVPFSPHNTYLDLLVSIGLFGAIAFVLCIILGIAAALGGARRSPQQRLLGYGLAAGLFMFLVQAFTETFEQQPRIAPLVWAFVAVAEGGFFALQERARAEAARTKESPAHVSANGYGSRVQLAAVAEIPAEEDTLYERASQILPAIPRTWGFDTGEMPAVENPWSAAIAVVSATGEHPAIKAPAVQPLVRAASDDRDIDETPSGIFRTQRAAEDLLGRAPSSFAWNQIYQIWFFAANFLLSIELTRGLAQEQYGIYAVLTTIIGTLTFSFALGLEDAATVFLPRVLTRDGQGAAGSLVRRLLVSRMLVMGCVGFAMVIALPTLLPLVAQAGILGGTKSAQAGGLSELRLLLMALYLVGSGLANLEGAFFNAVLNSRTTLIVGGISQALMVTGAGVLIYLGYGVDGVLLGLSVASWLSALVYLIPLLPFLRAHATRPVRDMGDLRKLMVGAWLTNVTNGALGKQMDIILMSIFAISIVQIGYYNLAYQLANIVGLLLISGLGGVGMATLSAALAAGGKQRLAEMWRVSLMVQALFAVPLQIFCLVQADAIIDTLYGSQYGGAVLLFRVFLAFSILGRLIGGGTHQSALYVLKRQRLVLLVRWTGLVLNVALDVTLIPRYGPVGALLGTGFTQVAVGLCEMLLVNRKLPSKYPIKFASDIVSAAALPAILLVWWTPSGLLGLATSAILYTSLFILILMWLGLSDAGELKAVIANSARLQQLLGAVDRFVPSRFAPAR